jgi:hypothetical protein
MDPNLNVDFAADWGKKELEEITYCEAVMGSLMYVALATWPDMTDAVATLSC